MPQAQKIIFPYLQIIVPFFVKNCHVSVGVAVKSINQKLRFSFWSQCHITNIRREIN